MMAKTKVKELNANAHRAKPYVPQDMRGRVRHDTIWRRALARWKPGTRVSVYITNITNKGEVL